MAGQPIDFVITWVDDQDEAWRQERARCGKASGVDNSECRYRNWGLLRYWFRGVEKFAPWVRKIHFVTWGHLPPWMNTDNPKLHIVRHEDYIPTEYLPTFNSHILEIYMDRIQGLSEHFVYFNDDMFLIRRTRPEHFFRDGKPCDLLAFQPVVANPKNPVMSHVYLNDILVLCKYFDKRKNVMQQPGSYFHLGYPPLYFCYNMLELFFPLYTGLYTVHRPSPFCRQTFRELWEREENLLTEMSKNKFRSINDVTPCLFREWQKLSGNFCARNVRTDCSYFEVGARHRRLLRAIQRQKSQIICINDVQVGADVDVDHIRTDIQAAFQQILPEPSSFEK